MSLRVLIADDDPSVRSMLELVLGLEGFEVLTVPDGVQALRVVQDFDPDVIVLDVMMPVANGHEVARRLKAIPKLRDIPLVFCSALSSGSDTWEGWQLGADSYIAKPFDNERFIDELLRVTRQAAAVH
ncbi:MAG TPA: response regulator [Nitriliruptorales bacterium]